MGLKLAIVGATGLVGQELLGIIEDLDPELDDLGLYASAASAGSEILVRGNTLRVGSLEDCDFSKYDAALFSVGDELSARYVPIARKNGCAVVDKSNAFRLDPSVPLVVPGVNDHVINDKTKLAANPNCTTIILSHALGPINRKFGVKKVIAATYQSISGAGKQGIERLFSELNKLGFSADKFRPGQQSRQVAIDTERDAATEDQLRGLIAHNIQPQIGNLNAEMLCGEEVKLVSESRKILEIPELSFIAHSVRVPVPVGHSIAVTFQSALMARDYDEMAAALQAANNIDFCATEPPTPLDRACGRFTKVAVGRLRPEAQLKNGWSMFVCGDNLRIGAALNGWRILALMADAGVIPEFCTKE